MFYPLVGEWKTVTVTYYGLIVMQHQNLKFEKIPKNFATNSNLLFNFWFAQKSHLTEAKIFQVDNSQLKDGSIWN